MFSSFFSLSHNSVAFGLIYIRFKVILLDLTNDTRQKKQLETPCFLLPLPNTVTILIQASSDQHLISPYNITPKSHIKVTRKKGNDHQRLKLLIVKKILLVSTSKNVLRTAWRIFLLMLSCKGLKVED